MRPLESALKWNCTFLALIYSANRKQNLQPHLLPRESGCCCQDVLQQGGDLGVLAGWTLHPQLSLTLGDSSRWVSSCVLADVFTTPAVTDLPGAELGSASSSCTLAQHGLGMAR